MSTTVTIPNVPTSVSDVSVTLPDMTKLVKSGTFSDAQGRTMGTDYIYTGSDLAAVTKVSVRRTVKVDAQGNYTQLSMTVKVVAQELIDDGINTPRYEPIEFFIGFTLPRANPYHSISAISKALGFTYALTFQTVTTKVPDTDVLAQLLWGATDIE